jgi:hypothetical protein
LEDGAAERRFPATRFADEPEHFAFPQGEGNTVDGLDRSNAAFKDESALDREMSPDVFDF